MENKSTTTSFRINHIKPQLIKKAKSKGKKLHEYVVSLLEKEVNFKK